MASTDEFLPAPLSDPLYGVGDAEEHTVQGADGVRLHLETFAPESKGANTPPKKLPVVLIQTPYEDAVSELFSGMRTLHRRFARDLVRYGYVVAIGTARGTGRSEGCFNWLGPADVSDTLRVVEYLATEPQWASGRVGLYGMSHEGILAISAATSDDRTRSRYIKAIVPVAILASHYDGINIDGTARWNGWAGNHAFWRRVLGVPDTGGLDAAPVVAQRVCDDPEEADNSASYTSFYAARDYRPKLRNLRAPMLTIHGLADINVWPHVQAGFLDALPADTTHKIVIGQWAHDVALGYPDPDASDAVSNRMHPSGWRSDLRQMVRAWFDQYLLGLQTRVEDWPAVQVQTLDGRASDLYGRWREEAAWPTTGGPVGHLALGPEGRLGVASPDGISSYRETPDPSTFGGEGTGASAVFTTQPLDAPLHLTGQPSLHVWVRLSHPDAHIAVTMEALDSTGKPIARDMLGDGIYGIRSAQHLDPFLRGGFQQSTAHPAPTNIPLLVPIRLKPLDLIVPAGGRLRLTVGGNFSFHQAPNDEMLPSGSPGTVEVIHDCDHTSILRFLMPRADSRWLTFPDEDGSGPLPPSGYMPTLANPDTVDGGGLASTPVCGEPPARDDVIGPAREY